MHFVVYFSLKNNKFKTNCSLIHMKSKLDYDPSTMGHFIPEISDTHFAVCSVECGLSILYEAIVYKQ